MTAGDEVQFHEERVPRRVAPLGTCSDRLQAAVFEHIDGRRSIAEIARAIDLDVDRVSDILAGFAERKSIVFDDDGREIVEPYDGAIIVDADNAFVGDDESERATSPEIDPLSIFERPTRPEGKRD